MGSIARLSHVGFNVPRDQFEREREFWENVIGLKYAHGDAGQRAFFAADPLRDHEFIIQAVDGPVAAAGDSACILGHVSFDVPTAADVDELVARLEAVGIKVDSEGHRTRRRSLFTSPAGITFEINTPPYMNPRGNEAPARAGRDD
jgi:catechol 2,3-dioxygenase-like lactoylglutathione lyase family enzyme